MRNSGPRQHAVPSRGKPTHEPHAHCAGTPLSSKDDQATPVGTRPLKQRYDGYAKVTGTAKYAGDFPGPGLVHAYMVQSTIASGTIAFIDRSAAEQAYGVLAVLTASNPPQLPMGSSRIRADTR
jgi:CO/xanthine dehydrogenase Mo-binding subunit